MQTMSKTKKIILSALLLALSIVLSRFLSIKTPLLTITFNFVPIILAAVWLGPKYSTLIAGLSDVIGAVLFPFGEFFIGFTISSILTGLIYGLVLYKKERRIYKNNAYCKVNNFKCFSNIICKYFTKYTMDYYFV